MKEGNIWRDTVDTYVYILFPIGVLFMFPKRQINIYIYFRPKCGNIYAYWFEDLLAVNRKKEKKRKYKQLLYLRPKKKKVYIF